MPSRPIRALWHAGAVVLLSGVAVVATGTAGSAAGTDRPESYGGDATAASVELRVDRTPLPLPVVTDPFHLWVPYAETSLDSSGGADAIGSTLYPGQDVIGGPALLCEFDTRLCGTPLGVPDYPNWAQAQYPANPDDSAQLSQKPFPGTGPFEVTPNHMTAHADPERVEATAITGAVDLTGLLTVQDANAHSLQRFEGSSLVLTSESVLKGIEIGGQLHIDELRSTATARIDGSTVGAATANTVITGATVAGQAVTIDSTGVHAAGHGDDGALQKALNSALQQLASQGIDVRALGSSRSARPHNVAAETGGLLLSATHSVEGGPSLPAVGAVENGRYLLTASLGGAGVKAFAAPGVSFNFAPLPLPSAPAVTGGGAAPAATGSTGVQAPPAQTGTGPAAGAEPPAVAAGPAPKKAALPVDLTNKRLETLALVLLGYPLLMLLAAPFRAPARLPGAG